MVKNLWVAVRVRAEAEGGGAREACHRGSRGYYMHGCRTRLCVRAPLLLHRTHRTRAGGGSSAARRGASEWSKNVAAR